MASDHKGRAAPGVSRCTHDVLTMTMIRESGALSGRVTYDSWVIGKR